MKTKILLRLFVITFLFNIIIVSDSVAQSWSGLSYGLAGWVHSTGMYNGDLIVGGEFTWAGAVQANHIARWNGTTWLPIGEGLNGEVDAICVYNNQLFAGGRFTASGNGTPLNFIARWDGTSWIDVSGGMDSYVTSLVVYNNHLVAGGYFNMAEELPLNHIGQWNSQGWSPLGTGTGGSQGQVMAMTVWNNTLIAGGFFYTAGGISAPHIAGWDGSSWSTVGSGISGIVYALTVYQNNLVAGGLFTSAGGVSTPDIAQWDGSAWTGFGTGICCGTYGYVFALTPFGNNLAAGGIYTTAGGQPAANIAMWNGSTWIPLATTMSSSGTVQAMFTLTQFNYELIAGGLFGGIDAAGAGNIARYSDPSVYPACSGTPASGTITPSTTTFCDSGKTSLTLSGYSTGVTGITFQWQSSTDNVNFYDIQDENSTYINTPYINTATYYRCITTCNSSASSISPSAVINVDPGPVLVSAPNPGTYCSNGTVLLQASTGSGLTYRWRLNGTNITGATSSTYIASTAGAYSCRITKNGCSKVSNILNVSTSMCASTFNIRAYLQGFYTGFGMQNASLDPFSMPNDCDTLVLSLASDAPPYSKLYSDTSILHTDGTASFSFPSLAVGNSYYLVLNHRNSIETWSSIPVITGTDNSYDFTLDITSSYGSNLCDLGDGYFALFGGDISDAVYGAGVQDGVIESQDYLEMENAVSMILMGYVIQDITGDNVVESGDYLLMENNVSSLIFCIKP